MSDTPRMDAARALGPPSEFRCGAQLERELAAALARCNEFREALRKIEKGEGRFSSDPLEHAANTIDDMKAMARTALERSEG